MKNHPAVTFWVNLSREEGAFSFWLASVWGSQNANLCDLRGLYFLDITCSQEAIQDKQKIKKKFKFEIMRFFLLAPSPFPRLGKKLRMEIYFWTLWRAFWPPLILIMGWWDSNESREEWKGKIFTISEVMDPKIWLIDEHFYYHRC